MISSILTPRGIMLMCTPSEASEAGATDAQIAAALEATAWATLRAERTRRLDACVWTMVPDAQLSAAQKTAWKDYRQALRDLPATIAAANLDPAAALIDPAIWPIPPAN